MSTSPRTSVVAAGRQRRSAVRYTNLEKATSSPILTKPNRNVEFDESVLLPTRVGVVAGMQGWRKTMEDRHALCSLPASLLSSNEENSSRDDSTKPVMLAVFDGHRGTESAELCAGLLPRGLSELVTSSGTLEVLTSEPAKVSDCCIEVDAALRRCWEDRSLTVSRASSLEPNPSSPSEEASSSSLTTSLQSSPQELSVSTIRAPEIVITGSTANVIIGCPESGYYCLNVGDSRGYLICKRHPSSTAKGDTPVAAGSEETAAESPKRIVALPAGVHTFALSKDHRTACTAEAARIEKAGGYIVNSRVNGKLSVTRAFGDFDLKPNLLDVVDNPLICVPEVTFQASLPPTERIAMLQRRGTALYVGDKLQVPPTSSDETKSEEKANENDNNDKLISTCYGSLVAEEPLDYDVSVVGCDGVWELQTINDIAVRLDKKLTEIAPLLQSEKPSDVEARASVIEEALREVIVSTLSHCCANSCDQTGGSLGADNLSLGFVLYLI